MYRPNYLQKQRAENLARIRKWVEEAGPEPNRELLLRKMEQVIGCTRKKAEDYLRVVLDE